MIWSCLTRIIKVRGTLLAWRMEPIGMRSYRISAGMSQTISLVFLDSLIEDYLLHYTGLGAIRNKYCALQG